MNCRKQLGHFIRGNDYHPPTQHTDLSKLKENLHLTAYVRQVFHMFERKVGTSNITVESYMFQMEKIFSIILPKAPSTLVRQNLQSDSVFSKKDGMTFEVFFESLLRYLVLIHNTSDIQSLINILYDLLNKLFPKSALKTDISLTKAPYPFPLNYWASLINASTDIRPCFIISGVNTQRSKLFERILADQTGCLLLDIPNLINWPFRPASVENARLSLLKGGYLSYQESEKIIIECAKDPIANYRGWIIPSSFHKSGFDFSSLFSDYSEYEKRCFCIDLEATLDSLIEISQTRLFDPQDEKILSSLEKSSLSFIQRLKRREFVGRDIDIAPEEEEEQKQAEEEEDKEEVLMLYKPPKYSSPEELGDETTHPEEEDEAKQRAFVLPEESVSQITNRYNFHMKDKPHFNFKNPTKFIPVDATQPLKEMANIVCDKASIVIPSIYPIPSGGNEEEDTEEKKFSPVGENCVVSLIEDHQTIKGISKFEVIYYSLCFRFVSVEYRNKFASNPVRYLKEYYHSYHHRIVITGCPLSGKSTLANQLSNLFDTPVVGFKEIIDEISKIAPKKIQDDSNSVNDTKDNADSDSPALSDEVPSNVHVDEKPNESANNHSYSLLFPKGYITTLPSIDIEILKQMAEAGPVQPEALIILKLNSEEEIATSRVKSSDKAISVQVLLAKIAEFNEKLNDSTDSLKDISIPMNIIDASHPAEEVYWSSAYSVDKLLPKCGESQEDEAKFGFLGSYCPITLKEKQLLQNGSELTTTFQNSLFGFADESALERFKSAPLAFTNSIHPVPPPRILLLGSRGTSKTSIASEISKMHSTTVYTLPQKPKFVPITEEEEEPDVEETARKLFEPFIKQIIRNSEEQRKGWIIEGSPFHSSIASLISEAGLKPDFVILLEQDEKWALMRNRHRISDEEQILSEESELSSIAKEVATSIAEGTHKGEPVIIETSRRFSSIMEMVHRSLQRELSFRNSLYISQSSTIPEDGLSLLKSHKVFLSQFGKYCPVCLYERGALVLTDMSISSTLFGRIFFFDTNKHRQEFIDDPYRFIHQPQPPVFPSVPRIAIIGNSELALRLADSTGSELIRLKDVIARVSKHQTTFGAKVRKILASGGSVDAPVFKQALRAVLLRHDCQIKGFILDGYPKRLSELLEMRSFGLMPNDLVVTEGDGELIKYSEVNFHNVIYVDKNQTHWNQLIDTLNKLNLNTRRRWESLVGMDENRPYCVQPLDVSPEAVEEFLSPFGHYCPVAYISHEVSIETPKSNWSNIVKYEGRYYHMHDEESLQAFLTSPIPFVRFWDKYDISFAQVSTSLTGTPEIEGYDIIDLSKGQFVKGNTKIVASYNGKYYRFQNDENRSLFCRNTSRYITTVLPAHRPVDQPHNMTQVFSLPPVAFLEQTVGNVITECIVQLVLRRPKIPGKDMVQSMNEYIASYIRAHSPDIGPLLSEQFNQQHNDLNTVVGLAMALKNSLETPMELRNEEEHEKLCKLWENTIKACKK